MGILRLFHCLASRLILAAAVVLTSVSAWAIVTNMTDVELVHDAVAVHVLQTTLNALPPDEEFLEAFEIGDELFGAAFNALDGGGANVGRGQRYTRVPRADLQGAGEWRNHTPDRVTGPNAGGCFECHEQPFEDGAGTAALNVHRDPFRTGLVGQFVERNTPHVFAPGAIQRLAEEMTDELSADQARLVDEVCRFGGTRSVSLTAKGVNFGTLVGRRASGQSCRVTFDTDGVRGIDFLPSVDNPAAPPSSSSGRTSGKGACRSFVTSIEARRTTSSACRPWRSSAATSTATSTASATS